MLDEQWRSHWVKVEMEPQNQEIHKKIHVRPKYPQKYPQILFPKREIHDRSLKGFKNPQIL